MTSHLRSLAHGLTALALLILCPTSGAQEAQLQQFDPSDVYFQAWLKVREAETAEAEEKFLDAFNHYKKAADLFDTVGVYHPDWKPHLVKDRQATTKASMDKIREEALREQRGEEKKMEGIVVEGPGTPTDKPDLGIKPLTPDNGIKPLTPAESRQLEELQRQIRALTTQLQNVTNDRDANAAQLRRALKDLESQRDSMATAPLEKEVADLTARIDRLQQERQAMADNLAQSRTEQQETLTRLAALQAERDAAMARTAELENSLNVQRNAANDVVRGLQEQLKSMKAIAAEKDRLLAQANVRNAELEMQLKESHAEIADLREERSGLLKERDHMASLLQLNETDRVKILIEQNQTLGKELKEARERLAEVAADNNRTAQDLIEAKSQLAIAKSKIIQLNADQEEQAGRLAELEERLKEEGKALEAKDDPRSREEIAVLQGIIDRTLSVQTRRRKAQEILVETVKRKAIEDPEVWGAISMLGGQELTLTEEETKLVETRAIDGEFIFGDHVAPEVKAEADNELQRSIGFKSDLARRAFSNGRFLVAREFFESILDEHPGHVITKLNLGVVHLRNDDPQLAIESFNDALTIRPDLPYAEFMLGAAYYSIGGYEEAREHLLTALQLDPANAKAQVFLGSIAAVGGQIEDADKHWQEAIRLDPTLSEPLYNLAILRVREGKKAEALDLYRKSLENGRQPDPGLEAQIGS